MMASEIRQSSWTSEKINIAFIIDTIQSPTAGTEKQLLLLLKHLNREKFNPFFCVLRSSEWLEHDFSLCPLFVARINSLKEFKSHIGIKNLVNFLKKEQIDIVQTYFEDANWIGIVAAKLAGVKILISSRRNQGYFKKKQGNQLKKLINKQVSVFLANSKSTKEWLILSEKIPKEKIEVIYNGFDLESYQSFSEDVRIIYRKRLNIPLDAPVVGIVANLRPVKGIDLFIQAAAIVGEKFPDTQFLIIGDGPEKAKLESLSLELGLNEKTHFLGKVDDVPPLLKIMDIGVLTSHSESFSNSVVEYMVTGLPVVCTDVGGIREAVTNGEGGFLVPPGDYKIIAQSIIYLLTHRNQGASMGIFNKEKIKGLVKMEHIIQTHEQLYEKMLTTIR